jgi:hypothetical protein
VLAVKDNSSGKDVDRTVRSDESETKRGKSELYTRRGGIEATAQ